MGEGSEPQHKFDGKFTFTAAPNVPMVSVFIYMLMHDCAPSMCAPSMSAVLVLHSLLLLLLVSDLFRANLLSIGALCHH